MNKFRIVVLMALSLCYGHVQAASLFADPAVSSATARLSALINLDTEARLGNFEASTPILDVIDARRSSVNLSIPPSQLQFAWVPDQTPDTVTKVSQSLQAIVRVNGALIETFNQTKSSSCQGTSCTQVPDELILSASVREAIVRGILEGTTLGRIMAGKLPTGTAVVEIERTFPLGSNNIPFTSTKTLNISANQNGIKVNIDQSRILSISGRALTSSLPVGTSANIPTNLQWTAEFEVLGAGSSINLRSSVVELRLPNGQVLQRTARELNTTIKSTALGSRFSGFTSRSSTTFNDSLSIPGILVSKARSEGADALIVSREFLADGDTYPADIRIPLGSASLAEFQIVRVGLRFNDNSVSKVVPVDTRLSVIADINYLGSGTLTARWNWAPVSTGVPFFRPLPPAPAKIEPNAVLNNFALKPTSTLVREFLNNAQRIQLVSPALPTGETGGALVTLTIESPDILFELPVLRYFVVPEYAAVPQQHKPAPLTLLSPDDGVIGPASVFRWQAVQGASAYRYECYGDERLEGDMITGAVVPGSQLQATVSSLVLEHLQSAERYWCRVVAISADGQLQAASDAVGLVKTD